ncbi:MAG: AI-2E family transporter [Candidatus Adiutrix sp.]|jgi:predicted PurR-regulated permease PerM|nr:AI-2E family transporter [Candidatus Adiutrix sp.]
MNFSLAEFAKTNKVILIWTAFAGLLYIMKAMFGLVFITYVMCFVTHGLTHKLHRAAGLGRRFMVMVIYLLCLALIAGFLYYFAPSLVRDAKTFTEQMPKTLATIDTWVESNLDDNETLALVSGRIRDLLTPEQMISKGWTTGLRYLERSIHYVSWFFLGLLFSFLIMLDLPKLTRAVRELRFTRLSSVYEETADSVILFAQVVGENFRAQIMVSALNTALTAIGLNLMGIGGVALLCTMVFFCGLIPVLGVFISSIPILLMAVNTGGINLSLWAALMIVFIHLMEAYVLNPHIVSAVMKINPVLTLIILYIAHSLIGLWGMLLGVPISVYIYRQMVVGLPPKNQNGQVSGADNGGADND